MGRMYAGILGPLAMTLVIGRGLKESSGLEGTLSMATISLILFAGIGFVLGQIAQNTVEESVRTKMERELAQEELARE